ncbi:MAG: two-component system sensor histidine kinase FlrB [Planctomycetota bacterium]
MCTCIGVDKLNQISNRDLLQAFQQFNQLSESLNASFDEINQTAHSCAPITAQTTPNSDQLRIEHLNALLNAIPGGVVVLDPRGRVAETNQSARQLLGEPLAGESWRDIVQRVFLSELDQGELKTADGRQFSISTCPLGYAPGQILLLSDVTQTRELQRTAQQNLHLMTMGKMMASLAHQLRTPLAASMLYLSQLVAGVPDPQTGRSFSQKALSGIKHIEKMINDMLVFAHGGQFITTRFGVAELFAELEDQLLPQTDLRHACLQISGQECGAELQGNKDALLGALANLCMNALQASKKNPLIRIKLEITRHGLLSISLQDNGCGMDRHTRAHLFDPFFSTKTDGTGLGLAVVKSVIESHQGRIAVYSRPGNGCRFRIFLPCRQGMKIQVS